VLLVLSIFIVLCVRVGEGVAMAKPPAQLNGQHDDPDIGQEVVVAPVVTQAIAVAPYIPQVNAAEPGIDEAGAATGISVNTGHLFLNAALSKDRDELIEWCKNVALNAGFSMVIEKSDKGNGDKRKPFFILGCERGGVYKELKRKLKREDTATRKCECRFRLRGYFLVNKQWKLSVVNGEHNHKMAKNLERKFWLYKIQIRRNRGGIKVSSFTRRSIL
jgi:hypothetical protein